MTFQKSATLPLPLCILLTLSCSLVAQQTDDPFGYKTDTPFAARVESAKAKQTVGLKSSDEPDIENEKLKAFQADIVRFQKEYETMLKREVALTEMNEKLLEFRRIDSLLKNHKDLDKALKERVQQLIANVNQAESEIALLQQENNILKKRVKQVEASEEKARETALQATENRNEMHQRLFEKLIMSDENQLQELALTHFFECGDKQPIQSGHPINVYTPELLRRIRQLTDSNSDQIKQLAGRTLATVKPEMAMSLGIQFAPNWKPVEFANAGLAKQRILVVLEQQSDFDYEDVPIVDFLEELQDHYGVNFRATVAVDPKTKISYRGRGVLVSDALSEALKSVELDYVITDSEVVVMKKTNPELLVTRSYNIRHLFEAGKTKIELEKLVELVQNSLGDSTKVEALNDHVFWVKTNETNHLKVQKKLGALAPTASWWIAK